MPLKKLYLHSKYNSE